MLAAAARGGQTGRVMLSPPWPIPPDPGPSPRWLRTARGASTSSATTPTTTRARPAHGRRPRDDGDVRPRRAAGASCCAPAPSPSPPTSTCTSPSTPCLLQALDAELGALRRGDRVDAFVPARAGAARSSSTLPLGAGLSSSAALEVATALALGCETEPMALARTCQRAEQAATGVPTGIMDQLVVSAARQGSALLIDFADLSLRHVEMPRALDVVVVHSGETRVLEHSAYAERRAECEAAAFRDGAARSARPRGGAGDPRCTVAAPGAPRRHGVRPGAGVHQCASQRRSGRGGSAHVREPPQPGPGLRGVDSGARRRWWSGSRHDRASTGPG